MIQKRTTGIDSYILAIFFYANALAFAQASQEVSLFQVQQNLHSRQFTSILYDKYGFLWLGTENGLYRWDGIAMTAFTAQSGDTSALPSNTVLHLYEDKRGILWIGTAAGLARFVRHKNTFSTVLLEKPIADVHEDSHGVLWCWIHTATMKTDEIIAFNPESSTESCWSEGKNGLRSAYLYSFLNDKNGNIWLGTTNGLHRFDREKGLFSSFLTDNMTAQSPARLAKAHILSLQEDSSGNILVGTSSGLLRTSNPSATHPRFEPFMGANSTTLLRESGIALLHKSTKGDIFAATMQRKSNTDDSNSLIWINLNNGTMSSSVPVIPLEGKAQNHRLAFDKKGTIWWGVGNGVVQLSPQTMNVQLLLTEQKSQTRINTPVVGVAISASSAVLFAQANASIRAIPPARQPFHAIPYVAGNISEAMLLSPNISALKESPDGALWIGYMGGSGLSRLDRSTIRTGTPSISHFRQDPTNPRSIAGYNGETNIYTFYGDKGGTWWVGSYLLARVLESSINNRKSSQSISFGNISLLPNDAAPTTAMVEDSYGNFWVGTTFGLFLIDKKSGVVIKRFTSKSNNDATLGNNNIHALIEDRSKNLWIGHDGGVDRFDPVHKRCSRLKSSVNSPIQLTPGAVTSLLLDTKGLVWIGTRGGLASFDPDKNIFVHRFTKRDGLGDGSVCALCEDTKGNIWVTTHQGLCCIQRLGQAKDGAAITTFSRADGLADDDFIEGAATRTRDGMLWFGTRSALIYIHPDSIQQRQEPVKAIFTGLKKFGEPTELDEYIADAAQIDIAYNDRSIAFEYAVPSAFYPEKVKYAYKLEGLDTSWVDGEIGNEAKYTSLPDGTYTLYLKASDMNGVWQQKPTTLLVVVHPPWWRTWWFITSSVLLSGGAGFFAYKRRIRKIEMQNQQLERVVAERTVQLQEANTEVHRQLEVLDEQAREIEISNTRLYESNVQLDTALTQLKDTQTQLVQSERINATGMLTAGVMHEINNPNASIHSALELTIEKIISLEQYFSSLLDEESRRSTEAQDFITKIVDIRDILRIALNGSARIHAIVMSLQRFTKHQLEGTVVNNVATEVHTTVAMFLYQFKGVTVLENIAPTLTLEAQWNELNQALLNLFINAAQAEATYIQVSSKTTDDKFYQLIVTDNGKGMSEDVQKHIFQPFYTTKSTGNTGLGLSITRQIIERHGGTITVESQLGKGATFVVSLPRNLFHQ